MPLGLFEIVDNRPKTILLIEESDNQAVTVSSVSWLKISEEFTIKNPFREFVETGELYHYFKSLQVISSIF
jgi:hypothetical protein